MTTAGSQSDPTDPHTNGADSDEKHTPDKLTIVGIGASAGGLSSLRTFFSSLPPDTGMTFVVVVHLSPDHESILPELLRAYTSMPVTQVQARTAMEPNHVYVIPPAKRLLVAEGHLDLQDLEQPRGLRLQIDNFFRTLAEEHGDGAAIILSGSGSDGAVGIRAIKERGGLLLVQAPEEAEYDGMPKSAIATGLVDVVAPVAELAAQLVGAKRTQSSLELLQDPKKLPRQEQRTLVQILTQLRERTGHDFSGYKEATVLRRITRRMQLLQVNTLAGYLNRLRQKSEEIDALYRDVLIHVTEFFRDAEAWEQLAKDVVPKLFAEKKADDRLRVWTVGCATGEEAYSVAMLLLEYASQLEIRPQIQIFATDLGNVALDFARKGVYPEAIAADVSEARLARFFVHENSHYQVRAELRELVLFTPHNLLQDPPFSKLDLIICRNVLIYLQRPVQEHVFQAFYYALRPTGYLFLGSAESGEGVTELFETVHKRHRLYRRKQQSSDTLVLPALPLLPRHIRETPYQLDTSQPLPSAGEQHRLLLEEIGLPGVLVDEQHRVLHYSETAWRFLSHPAGPPTMDLVRLVRPELQKGLRLALQRAFSQHLNTASAPVSVPFNGSRHVVTILVRPNLRNNRALVLFWENSEPQTAPQDGDGSQHEDPSSEFEARLLHSEEQLQKTREEYESSVEALRAANEELQSTNEEYRSTLEELETSKEELQSINEELQSVNQELKVRMEEIATANSDLQNLFAATEIATLFLDRDLCVKRYTPRAAELFNLMPVDLGRPIWHLRSKLDYPTLEADVRRVLSDLVPLEYQVQSEDKRWFLVGVRPYRTANERADGVVVTCVDISTNKANEVALSEANQQLSRARDLFSLLFHSNPIPTALARLKDGVILDANDAYLSFFEMTAAARETRLQLGHWLAPAERKQLAARVRSEGHIASFEITTQNPSGKVKTALVSIQRVEQNGVAAAISAFVDVTELKQTQETLRRSEERLRLTLASVTDYAYVILDAAGHIVDWQAGAEQMFGYSRAEVLGQPLSILFTPEDRAKGAPEAEIEQAARAGRAADERWHLRKDGTRFFMSGVMVPLRDGEIIGYVKVARDLTESKLAGEALEREVQTRTEQVRALVTQLTMSEQAERRRISAILHDDLQQQLFSVNMQVAMLREMLDERGLEDAQQLLDETAAAVRETVQLTRNLSVSLSPPVLHDEGLHEAVRWLASFMEQQHGLAVEVKTENTLPPLDEDLRVLLFQLVRELLFNVVKHADTTSATVTLAMADEQLRIEVNDRGRGFDPSEQISNSTSQGLQRAESRLRLLGGSVQVHSSAGKGTRVTIYVPHPDIGRD